jgi:hypothetical protein
MFRVPIRRGHMTARKKIFRLPLDDFDAGLDALLSPSHAIRSPEFLQGRDE